VKHNNQFLLLLSKCVCYIFVMDGVVHCLDSWEASRAGIPDPTKTSYGKLIIYAIYASWMIFIVYVQVVWYSYAKCKLYDIHRLCASCMIFIGYVQVIWYSYAMCKLYDIHRLCASYMIFIGYVQVIWYSYVMCKFYDNHIRNMQAHIRKIRMKKIQSFCLF